MYIRINFKHSIRAALLDVILVHILVSPLGILQYKYEGSLIAHLIMIPRPYPLSTKIPRVSLLVDGS